MFLGFLVFFGVCLSLAPCFSNSVKLLAFGPLNFVVHLFGCFLIGYSVTEVSAGKNKFGPPGIPIFFSPD